MPRTFAYLRVSTLGQTTDNQRQEIGRGLPGRAQRVITETVSGSVATDQRKGFVRLLDRLERDDVLVVTKLDRLGRTPWTSAARSSASTPSGCGCTASLSAAST